MLSSLPCLFLTFEIDHRSGRGDRSNVLHEELRATGRLADVVDRCCLVQVNAHRVLRHEDSSYETDRPPLFGQLFARLAGVRAQFLESSPAIGRRGE